MICFILLGFIFFKFGNVVYFFDFKACNTCIHIFTESKQLANYFCSRDCLNMLLIISICLFQGCEHILPWRTIVPGWICHWGNKGKFKVQTRSGGLNLIWHLNVNLIIFLWCGSVLLVGLYSHWHPDVRRSVSGSWEEDYFSFDGAKQYRENCGDWHSHW